MLDPTNSSGPYYGKLKPLLQVRLQRYNPVSAAWGTRFRGFVEEWNYDWDPSQKVNRLELQLVDILEILGAVEMYPGYFGDPPDVAGNVQFDAADANPATTGDSGMSLRIKQVWADITPPGGDLSAWFRCFSGNVGILKTIYSPGESALSAIQDAAEAEFPSVGNVYGDRFGRLVVHGRYARFDPAGTAANIGDTSVWDFHDWKAGDGAAVSASPSDTAQIRSFGTNRGLSRIYNRGLASPKDWPSAETTNAEVQSQVYVGTAGSASIAQYGIRPWTSENLLTMKGYQGSAGTPTLDGLAETKTFASYYVQNYSQPKDRVSTIGFRSINPIAPGAAANWDLLTNCDIGDRLTLKIASPGGGGFDGSAVKANQYIVEGIHEEAHPLSSPYDDVTLTLDVSPFAYAGFNPYA